MSIPASQVLPALPLATEKVETLTQFAAGLAPDALLWSSGFLAGMAAAGGVVSAEQPLRAESLDARLTILFGSQTGNGQRLAEELALAAAQRSVAARVVNMADYRVQDIKKETALAIIVSTHGDGEPPDDAEALFEYLMGERAPQLATLRYSVLALGDSSYPYFCKTGVDFDERLAALGAQRYGDRVELDLDYAEAAAAWSEATLDAARDLLGEPGVGTAPALHAVSGTRFSVDNPLAADVVVNQKITGRESSKDVRHIEFDIAGQGLDYLPGDALGVVVANPPVLVAEITALLGFAADERVDGTNLSVLLTERHEITVASRAFVERYAALDGGEGLKELLVDESRAKLAGYLASRQIVDIVREYPVRTTPAEFVACLRALKPRLYSIASSPLVSEDEVAITVAAVRYSAFDRDHWGAASTHLADRTAVGDVRHVYVEPNPRFRLPADGNAPVIMIGPGTGVAPFRAFMQHREASGAEGRNWLIFGDRNAREDFLYQLDWARYRKRGLLTRMDVAFSRDQADKIYVQDRLREHAGELARWINDGAYIYVCGDAEQMAPDVHAALVEVLGQVGAADGEAALKELKRAGRYQRDVY